MLTKTAPELSAIKAAASTPCHLMDPDFDTFFFRNAHPQTVIAMDALIECKYTFAFFLFAKGHQQFVLDYELISRFLA
jgi:hypothetical protein